MPNLPDPKVLLSQIEKSYNGTYNSSIRMTPDELHIPAYKRYAMDPIRVLKAASNGKLLWEDGDGNKLIVARELMNTTVGRNKRPHQWDEDAHNKKKDRILNTGDYVRIQREKGKFEKGRKPNWSEEVFKISHRMPNDPKKYILEDDSANKIIGSFYIKELQKLPKKPESFPVEVIKTRKKGGQQQYLVRWLSDKSSKPEWIPARSLLN